MFLKKLSTRLGLMGATAGLLFAAAPANAEIIVMGGNPEGSLFYAQAQALASVIGEHTDIRVDVLPQSATVFFPMFETGEVDIGIVTPLEARVAYDGKAPNDIVETSGRYDMRTIMVGSPMFMSLVVRGSSDIESMADLKGKRIVNNYGAFTGSTLSSRATIANGGLNEGDYKPVGVTTYVEGVNAVIEGRADAAMASIGSGIIQQLNAAEGARILPIDGSPEAMERTQAIGPALVARNLPAGPVGVEQDMDVLSYGITLVARPDLSDETIKTILDAIWENYEELADIHPSLARWTPDRYASTEAVIPFHPAAVEFYKSKGAWSDEAEARQQELLDQAEK